MIRDLNPSGKSHSKHHSFIGEQPRKFADKNSKKSHHYYTLQDSDDLSRSRHIYDRAASKNITREILRASQF